jgi:hypothetical protein
LNDVRMCACDWDCEHEDFQTTQTMESSKCRSSLERGQFDWITITCKHKYISWLDQWITSLLTS